MYLVFVGTANYNKCTMLEWLLEILVTNRGGIIMATDINVTASNMSELTSAAFMDCLFRKDEDTTNYVKVEGITNMFGLHPQRLEEKRELVTALLAELPAEFKEGWTFLNLCTTKDGEQWTGFHQVCEQLVVMAIGLDLMEYTIPRQLWETLPGGVPYLTVK